MVGQAVLRECLLDPEILLVAAVGRSKTGIENPKLREIVHADLSNYVGIEDDLRGQVLKANEEIDEATVQAETLMKANGITLSVTDTPNCSPPTARG